MLERQEILQVYMDQQKKKFKGSLLENQPKQNYPVIVYLFYLPDLADYLSHIFVGLLLKP